MSTSSRMRMEMLNNGVFSLEVKIEPEKCPQNCSFDDGYAVFQFRGLEIIATWCRKHCRSMDSLTASSYVGEIYGGIETSVQCDGGRERAYQNHRRKGCWEICPVCESKQSDKYWWCTFERLLGSLFESGAIDFSDFEDLNKQIAVRYAVTKDGKHIMIDGHFGGPPSKKVDSYIHRESCCGSDCWLASLGFHCQACRKPCIPSKRWRDAVVKLTNKRFTKTYNTPESIYQLRHKAFCGLDCCLLAIETAISVEQEQRILQKEIKCVQEVKRALSKAKQLLKKPQNQESQEALRSLKKEFERAATSRT